MAGNKFWGGDSGTESSESSSDSDEAPALAKDTAAGGRRQMTRWAEESSSDDEPEKRRTVRTAADKRFDQIREKIKCLKNHTKIDDFTNLVTDYEALLRMVDKMKGIIEQEGGPPTLFIKAITQLELYVEEAQDKTKEEGAVKLTSAKQKAFNTLRAKVRKGNKDYQEQVEKCKEHPSDFESDGDDKKDDADSDDSESGSGAASGSESSNSSSSSSDDSDSDSSSSSDSDSDSSSSDSDSFQTGSKSSDDEDKDEDSIREKLMLRWLITDEKKAKGEAKTDKKKEETAAAAKRKKGKKPKDERDKTPKNKEHASASTGKGEEDELSPEELMNKIREIAQSRGRKGFERKKYLGDLQLLMPHAAKQGSRSQLYILSSMASVDFDNTGGAFLPMKLPIWIQAIDKVTEMVPLLVQYHQELVDDGIDPQTHVMDDEDDPRSYPKQQILFASHVEKLDDELYKALQFTVDVYGDDYSEILGNSSKFIILMKRVITFFETTKQTEHLGILAMRLIEQLHYKPDMLNAAVFAAIQRQVPTEEKESWVWPSDSTAYIAQLCRYVYSSNRPDLVGRASFCQVYHLALHGHFQQARDLLHLGNLTELAETSSDVRTQILNNRCVAQMGLCAFRLGKIQDAHQFLQTVCQHNKARELLAQGLAFQRRGEAEKTQEQEQQEKLRQLPYHMHINLEVLDSAHHICAMLLEIPNMAMHAIDPGAKPRIISRVLRRHLEMYDKQQFIGPPENAKEAVVCAAKALQTGDWQSACGALEDLKIWEHVDPGNSEAGVQVKEMIKVKVKTEALRTYLFAYASIYDAFHLDQLIGMFDLPAKTVHSTVSKMMYENQLTAFWDESSKYVLVQHSEPSYLQRLALNLAEKGAQAVENNERLADQKGGGSAFKKNEQQGGGQWDNRGGGQGRRGFGGGKGDKGQSKGKGKGKGGRGGFDTMGNERPRYRGWENARAGALRGNVQRGWANTPDVRR